MPAKKKTAKKTAHKAAKKPAKSFEEPLWNNAKRGSVLSDRRWCRRIPRVARGAENNVLSPSIKFVSDKVEERRAELIANGKQDYLDMEEWSQLKETIQRGSPKGRFDQPNGAREQQAI